MVVYENYELVPLCFRFFHNPIEFCLLQNSFRLAKTSVEHNTPPEPGKIAWIKHNELRTTRGHFRQQ